MWSVILVSAMVALVCSVAIWTYLYREDKREARKRAGKIMEKMRLLSVTSRRPPF